MFGKLVTSNDAAKRLISSSSTKVVTQRRPLMPKLKLLTVGHYLSQSPT